MIMRLYQNLKPTHIVVAFDRPGPTFRNELYKEYQVQRPKMEDDFISQISIVHDAVAAFGIPIFEADGFEADDVIGTIATHAKLDEVIIVTGDRDILQLVEDDHIFCYMPTKGLSEGKMYGEKEVVERLGIAPKLIPDYKALAGDQSDNYPGVPGIGPKTAIDLLNRFGSVEGVYKKLGDKSTQIKPTVRTKLDEGKESSMLSHTLATIRTDVPLRFEPDKAKITSLDTKEIQLLLETLHFPSLIKRLHGEGAMQEIQKTKKSQDKRVEKSSEQQQLF
jgi:DNA polymerase-1